jgi:uncharacterized membrane protein YbhN (UPF0104 family)
VSESPRPAPGGQRWVRFALSTALGLALVAALFWFGGVDANELGRTLARLDPLVFLGALALHCAIYVARAERFRVLLPEQHRPPRASLLAVTSAHNLAVYVLPAKTGEATLPLYLGRTCGVPAAESIASLVVSRLFDLAALCACMAVVTLALCLGGALGGRRSRSGTRRRRPLRSVRECS